MTERKPRYADEYAANASVEIIPDARMLGSESDKKKYIEEAVWQSCIDKVVRLYNITQHVRGCLYRQSLREDVDTVWQRIYLDALDAGCGYDEAKEYADTVSTYLAFAVGGLADGHSKHATHISDGKLGHTFTRQALPMVWDFAEANPFSDGQLSWMNKIEYIARVVERLPEYVSQGEAFQAAAQAALERS